MNEHDLKTQTTAPKAKPAPEGARNACKLCAPLGACVVFAGIEGCVPFLHGSQGCATYIRRYLISHFREPMDIASSSFSEEDAVFGGARCLKAGLKNVMAQYSPAAVGVATTCLAETIGEDLPRILSEYETEPAEEPRVPVLRVSTPSYSGCHMDGFHAAVRAVAKQCARKGPRHDRLTVLPGFVSPEDLRHLKALLAEAGVEPVFLPDYSRTLDGGLWTGYQRLQPGGVPLANLAGMGSAPATFELGRALAGAPETAASWLEREFGVPRSAIGLPVGLRETDRFFAELERVTGRPVPASAAEERGRLLDAMVDGHKYVSGLRAAVFGDQDLVAGLASFLDELGVEPVLCASGEKTGRLETCLRELVTGAGAGRVEVMEGADYVAIGERARELKPDFLVGASKGYPMARELSVPLVRTGFPIHDRVGGQRVAHVGYRGALQLFDRIVNALMESRQDLSETGYSYL